MAAKKKPSLKQAVKKTGSKKRSEPKAAYDVVAGSNGAAGSGNKRRKARIETGPETGKLGVLKPRGRLFGVNLARDIERNYSVFKSMMLQWKNNVVGSLAKIQINTEDEFAKESMQWFNKKFFNNCDFRGTEDFSKQCRNVAATKKREGDLIVVFDDGSMFDIVEGGTGKLLYFETDQIAETARDLGPDIVQDGGILRDTFGREIGYSVTNKRGVVLIPDEDTTILRRDPDDEDSNSVKMIKSTFRLGQGRGTADALAMSPDMIDCYEMRAKELQSAKVAASLVGTIKRNEAIDDFDDPNIDPTNENPSGDEVDSITLPEDQTKPANYERLESLTGGMMDYLADGDEFTLHDIKRPSIQMKDFIGHVTDSSGGAMGMAHAYAQLKADTSYTAFRGDMVMTWVSFKVEQKDLERELLDWVGVRAIKWAIKKGEINATPPADWEDRISWHLPKMPFVDELKERLANRQALKNGEKDFSEIVGPNYLAVFDALGKQIEEAKARGLPLSIFDDMDVTAFIENGGTGNENNNEVNDDE